MPDDRRIWGVYKGAEFLYAQDSKDDAKESRDKSEPAGFGQRCEVVEFVEVKKDANGTANDSTAQTG